MGQQQAGLEIGADGTNGMFLVPSCDTFNFGSAIDLFRLIENTDF
jgi:hypothetical protein